MGTDAMDALGQGRHHPSMVVRRAFLAAGLDVQPSSKGNEQTNKTHTQSERSE
jgi:hypothetical protein